MPIGSIVIGWPVGVGGVAMMSCGNRVSAVARRRQKEAASQLDLCCGGTLAWLDDGAPCACSPAVQPQLAHGRILSAAAPLPAGYNDVASLTCVQRVPAAVAHMTTRMMQAVTTAIECMALIVLFCFEPACALLLRSGDGAFKAC
nr:unnamed protein product [Digitaria exilis]